MSDLIFLDSEKKMPLMKLPVRSVLVPVDNGAVLLSPGSKLSTEQLKFDRKVTDVVAPNLFHCAGVAKAASAWPQAKIWGVEGAKALKPNVPWADFITSQNWPYQDELPVILLAGMPKVNETVFVHKKSKTLIVADLVFNMVNARGLGPRIIMGLFGTYRRFAVSKFLAKFITDKQAFERSLSELFAHNFENVVMSHGDVVTGGGRDTLLKALEKRGLGPK